MGYQTKSNFASSNLLNLVASDGMTMTVKAGEGDKFPSTGPFTCILFSVSVTSPDKDPTAEIVLIGSRTGDVLTVSSRAQEGTAAKEWVANSRIIHGLTAGSLAEFEIVSGSTAPDNPRLGQIWLDESTTELYPVFAPSNLVERRTLTANASSVTFTGLNSLVDGSYILEMRVAGNGTTDVHLFANGDAVVGNYGREVIRGTGTTLGMLNSAEPTVAYLVSGVNTLCKVHISPKADINFQSGNRNTGTDGHVMVGSVWKTTQPSSVNSLTLVASTGATAFGAGSVFSLYKQNTPQNLIDATIKNLDLVTSDYLLKVGETAKRTYTGATSVPLYVKCEEGVYEVSIFANPILATCVDGAGYLNANNTTYAGVISRQYHNASGTTVTSGVISTDTGFLANAHRLINSMLRIHTYTTAKQVYGELAYLNSASTHAIQHYSAIWSGSTIWSSLGAITFANAQSGTIIIKRIA